MYQEIQEKMKQLNTAVKAIRKTGSEYAKAEMEYKIKLSQEALKLKAENNPVTFINLIVYGLEDVATLRMKRDTAQAVYTANLEAINAIKLQIRIMENEYQREWGQLKYE